MSKLSRRGEGFNTAGLRTGTRTLASAFGPRTSHAMVQWRVERQEDRGEEAWARTCRCNFPLGWVEARRYVYGLVSDCSVIFLVDAVIWWPLSAWERVCGVTRLRVADTTAGNMTDG